MRRRFAFLLGMAAAAASPAAAQGLVERPAIPRLGAWQSIGPEGATVVGFAVDPSRSGTVYALTPQRLFRSIDGGVTWVNHASVPGRFPTGFAVSPSEEPVLFVTDTYQNLLRSTDGGRTWESPVPASGDYSDSVTVDPGAPNRVWAAVSNAIWRSTDRGATWELMSLPGGLSVLVDRSDGNRVFAGNYQGIFRTVDGGSSWQKVSELSYVRGFTQDPVRDDVIFGWTFDNYLTTIVKSTDGGDSWNPANKPPGFIEGLAVDAGGDVFATTEFGLNVSRDDGSTWTPLMPEFAPGAAVLADSSRPEVVYASAGLSVLRTSDGAATFSSSRNGLVNPGSSAIGLDPWNPRHLLVSAAPVIGDVPTVHSSHDGGSNWVTSKPGYVSAFALDPGAPGRVYAAGGSGVFVSLDGGSTWSRSSTGIDYGATTILIDPLDSALLYAGTCCGLRGSGGDVFKSSDSGATWHPTGYGFPNPPADTLWWIYSLAASPTGLIYASGGSGLRRSYRGGGWTSLGSFGRFVAVDPLSPDTVYASGPGLFRSDDGGASFQPLEGDSVDSVVPDPSESGVLYGATTDRGVLRSQDYGVSWERWSDGLRDLCIATLAIDAAGETLVAGTCSNGVYVRTLRPPRDTRLVTREQGERAFDRRPGMM